MDQKTYIRQVVSRLKGSGAKKKEIQKQLNADIEAALETGEPLNQILERMGNPLDMVAEFNRDIPVAEIKAAKRRKIGIGIGLGVAVLIGFILLIYWVLPKTGSIEDSAVFDQTQLTEITTDIIGKMSNREYTQIADQYATSKLKPYLEPTAMEAAKRAVAAEWGDYEQIKQIEMAELRQQGKRYAIVEARVGYAKLSVVYRLTFDADMRLAGIFIR